MCYDGGVKIDFHDAVQSILAEHREYHPDAYHYLHLAASPENREASSKRHTSHYSAKEFYHAFCNLLLKEYGPMAYTVLTYWGIHTTMDVGKATFYLIEQRVLSKRPHERVEDFASLPTPEQVLLTPFEPRKES